MDDFKSSAPRRPVKNNRRFLKRCITCLLIAVLVVSACLPISAAADNYASSDISGAESGDIANSWRYTDGSLSSQASTDSAIATLSSASTLATYSTTWITSDKDVAYGIDVSKWQGDIDWATVKSAGQVDFAIIRCGYGQNRESQDDEYWYTNADACTKYGIPFGVYLYSYADTVEKAKSEAEHVLRLIEGYDLSYPVYYDLEESDIRSSLSKTEIADIAEAFCEVIEAAGYEVGIYASYDWFTNYLTDSRFDQWERWVAQWNYTGCTYSGDYTMWQCSNNGSVKGISGAVDLNVDYGAGLKAVENVKATRITSSSATISYDKVTNADGYEIQFYYNGEWHHYVNTGYTSKEWSGFTPSTTYTMRVRAYRFSGSNIIYSPNWSDTYTFTTADDGYANLSTVTNVTASNTTTNSAVISYDKVSDADGYEIQFYYNGAWHHYVNTGYTSKEWTGFDDSTKFTFRVRAYRIINDTIIYSSNWSSTAYFSTKPLQVTGVEASDLADDGTSVTLTWDAQSNADGYTIYRLIGSTWTAIDTISGSSNNSYTVSGLSAGTSYSFKVRAYKTGTGNLGAFSDTLTVTTLVSESSIPAVTNVAASNTTTNSAVISYDKVSGADGYEIQFYYNGAWHHYVNTGYTSKEWTGFDDSTKFTFRVRAYRIINDTIIYSSNWSSTAYFSTKPLQVTGVEASDLADDGTSVTLTWDAQSNADGYTIYRLIGSTWTAIDTISGSSNNSYTVSGLSAGTSYSFKVRAYKTGTGNLGAFSDTLTVTTK